MELALFHEGLGQSTKFMPAKECLNFEPDPTLHYWYQDIKGNRYSFYEALSIINF